MNSLDKSIIFKPWGYEYLFSGTSKGKYGGWVLHLNDGYRTSAHFHSSMTTILYVISGKIKLEFKYGSTILKAGSKSIIRERTEHRMGAIEGDAVVIELETPSDKLDSIRSFDDWHRVGLPYAEGCKVVDFT